MSYESLDDMPKELTVEELIAQVRQQRSPNLDLSYRQLGEIPGEVFEMDWLHSLGLEGNNIENVPDDLARLHSLQELDLWNNVAIVSVTDKIGKLSELRRLSIGPECHELPNSIGRCRKLERLAIGQNNLHVLPDWLSLLRHLEELQLWSNELEALPDWWSQFSRLEVLNLNNNHLRSIPPSLGTLPNLSQLLLEGNELSDLPSSLARLRSLRTVTLEGNRFRELPEAVARWSNLRELSLANNRLSSLSPNIGALTELTELNVARNRLSSLPQSMGSLSQLETLRLEQNELSDLPISLAGLRSLRTVSLGRNRFHALPEAVTQWKRLEILDLNSDPSIIVSEFGDHVSLWRDSRRASRRRHQSELELLPPGLKGLRSLHTLLLHGNPRLGIPDELLGIPTKNRAPWTGSVDNLLNYYFRTRGGAQPLNEAKLVLLGWGGTGKTSLVNRLVHHKFDPAEVRTEGIEVTSWPVTLPDGEKVRLNIWDFGGQEIMHATHQFFLTARSLYLLVLNGRSGSADSDLDYWMRIVDSFAPDSPVIVALNQVKKDPFELDENGLRQSHPNIRAFVRTDCAVGQDGLGIVDLERTILRETDLLPDLRVSFPAAWFDIKDRLAAMAENYLTFERYRQLCAELGENEAEAQEQLADFLHSLGIALNYRDDPRLRDTHVLNPHWVTEGIYAMLNSRFVAANKGEVTRS